MGDLSQTQGVDSPLVTVAMPVYNAGRYLRLAVLSIISQTFTDWELLVIDDGSTDNALQDIADIDDARIRIFRDGVNKGLAARLNECIDLAQGQYFARMDSDDVSYPERLARQIAALQKTPELDLVATRAITIDENDQATGLFPYAISHEEICARPWRGFYFPHPSWMGKTAWFRKYRYTEPGPYFCEDQELLLRSYCDSQFVTLDEILFAYRIRSSVNWEKLAKTRWTILRVQLKNFSNLHQWKYVLLSLLAYCLKRGSDILKKISGNHFKPGTHIVDASVSVMWERVLKSLISTERAP